jgi:SAM-dependent methyltransferase
MVASALPCELGLFVWHKSPPASNRMEHRQQQQQQQQPAAPPPQQERHQQDEGAAGGHVLGNFKNYYFFHPPEARLGLVGPLGAGFGSVDSYLDIGCNAGDLTVRMHELLRARCTTGIDLDAELISRARAQFSCVPDVDFRTANALDFLQTQPSPRFSLVSCFSTTMWIHLNHGDAGFVAFLRLAARCAERGLLLETQPWKCYRSAWARVKKLGHVLPWRLGDLAIKTPGEFAAKFLQSECNMRLSDHLGTTSWGRDIVLFIHGTQ